MQQVCGKMSEVLKQKIRRDLSRWSRKLLLCIGLEDIGRELVGEEQWKRLYPLTSDWEQDKTSDFDPTQVPQQYFDISDIPHIDPSETPEEETNEEKNDLIENFFHLLPYWYFINRAFGVPPTTGTTNTSEVSEDLSPRNSVSEALDVQRLNCLLALQSLKQQQLQAQSGNADGFEQPFNNIQNLSFPSIDCFDEAENSATNARFHGENEFIGTLPFSLPGLSMPHSTVEDLDQPLDLTQKSKYASQSADIPVRFPDSSEPGADSKTAELRSNKTSATRGQRSGRGYTTNELEAALRDIQSGKLGTRRAAVIYGIPRSTLRNKVYKLGKDRSRSYFRQRPGSKRGCHLQNLTCPKSSPEELIGNSMSYSVVRNRDTKAKLSLHPSSFSSIPSNHSQGSFACGLEDEAENDDEEDSKLELEEISHEKKVLKEWLRCKLSRQGLMQNNSGNECLTGTRRSLSSRQHLLSDSSDNSDGSKEDSRQDVILKIPSVLKNKSSLSRLISQQKFKQRQENDEESDSTYVSTLPRRSYSSACTSTRAGGIGHVRKTIRQKMFGDNSMDESEVDSTAGTKSTDANFDDGERASNFRPASTFIGADDTLPTSDSNGKKSRPKRGKYRNYDRDALLKAVRAVQNGEMSVHRAGSFYGVPHSTLEYKVKERHLLRRTKKDCSSPKCIQKSSPDSSLSESDIPLSSPHLSGTVSNSSVHHVESRHLPLPSDFRETLSRYLNIDQPFRLHPHSASKSPDSSMKCHEIAKKASTESTHQRRRLRLDEDDNVDVQGGYNSSIAGMFQFGSHPRQSFDSLLDLSKKSE